MENAGNAVKEAERTGFEPAEGSYPFTGLANRRFRPLSHLSCRRRGRRRAVLYTKNTQAGGFRQGWRISPQASLRACGIASLLDPGRTFQSIHPHNTRQFDPTVNLAWTGARLSELNYVYSNPTVPSEEHR